MKEIVWSETGLEQFEAAFDYLAERNWTAAERLRTQVRDTLDLLARRPTGRPGQEPGTFEKIVQKTSYLLVFELAGDELRIIRMFHMAQDWRGWASGEGDDL